MSYVQRQPRQFGVGVGGPGSAITMGKNNGWGNGNGNGMNGMSATVKGVCVDGVDYDLSGWGGDDLGRVLGGTQLQNLKGVVRFEVEVVSGGERRQ